VGLNRRPSFSKYLFVVNAFASAELDFRKISFLPVSLVAGAIMVCESVMQILSAQKR
jgi:hypothetical protein